MQHTYYLVRPVQTGKPAVFGDRRYERDLVALLFAVYMRELGTAEPGRYDGASLAGERLRVVVSCNGAGSGDVRDVVP